MTITVVSQSTSERRDEAKQLFEQIKPLLDEGYSYMSACVLIGRCKNHLKHQYYKYGWFKDLKEHGEAMGYPYSKYSGKGCKRLPK